MKVIPGLVFLILLLPASVAAGEIYGSIKGGGKSIGQGVKVEIGYGPNVYSTETDRYGSYRLYVPEKGKCLLTVRYQQPFPSIEIYSYEGSVRYNLVLEKQDGKYSLRRE